MTPTDNTAECRAIQYAIMEQERRRIAEQQAAERQAANEEMTRRMKAGETLTDILLSQMPRTPEKTAEEQQSDLAFVALCRAQNPFTRRFRNLSHQIALVEIDKDAADELIEAAKLEDVDFARANPGMADADRAQLSDEIARRLAKK